MSETIRIATYTSQHDVTPVHHDVSWDELRDGFLHRVQETACDPCVTPKQCHGKKGPAWSPVRIEGKRANKNVREVTVLVLDLDHVKNPAALRKVYAAIEPYRYLLHSTHSHRPPNDMALRAAVALSRPVKAEEWQRFHANALRLLDLPADPAAKDPSRLFYLPSSSATHLKRVVLHEGVGEPLDVDQVLGAAAPAETVVALVDDEPSTTDLDDMTKVLRDLRRSARAAGKKDLSDIYDAALHGRSLAEPGGQEPALHRLMCGLAKKLPLGTKAEDVIAALVRPSIIAMGAGPEGLDHWFQKAAKSFDRAVVSRIAEERAREAFASSMTPFIARLTAKSETTPDGEEAQPEDPDAPAEDWTRKLIRVLNKDGTTPVRSCNFNVELILENAEEWRGRLRYNALTTFVELGEDTPLAETSSADTLPRRLGSWFEHACGIFIPEAAVASSMYAVAKSNAFDPLNEYVQNLPAWDGEVRAPTFLERAAGAVLVNEAGDDITAHVRRVSKKFLISAMARAISPGEQVDTVLVLEGDQGTGKTSLLRLLAGEFYASPKRDLDDKDTQLLVKRSWVVEIEELAAFKGKAYQNLKRFFSATSDKFRPPYGRYIEDHPRRCIFIGTVNPENVEGAEYLNDPTGNRRYWPVTIRKVDRRWVKENRDQVWAEALAYAREAIRIRAEQGEDAVPIELRWWLTDEEEKIAAKEVETRVAMPAPLETIRTWFLSMAPEKRPVSVTSEEVARDALAVPIDRIAIDQRIQTLVGHALKKLGFDRRRPRGNGRERRWFAPEELLAAPHTPRARPSTLALVAGGKP